MPSQIIPPALLGPAYRIYAARLRSKLDRERLPRHIGVILDGHRRHARAEGSDYASSYRAGMAKFLTFLGWARELEIPAVTAWVLSTDNLRRPVEELAPYYQVLTETFQQLPEPAQGLGYRLSFIGSLDLLPAPLVAAVKQAEADAGRGERRLTVALGYGGRQEIVDACRELVAELVAEGVSGDELPRRVDAEAIASHLYAADLPDPDLVIRTSGEARLSGFMLWQAAYAEYVFVDVHWPNFRRVDFLRAVRDFTRRDRRFGT